MKASTVIKKIQNGDLNKELNMLYVNKNLLDYQQKRYIDAINKYIELFGDDDINIFSVPGRSEICGNHTDHQRGKIVAAAINLDIIAIASKNENTIEIINEFDIDPVDINDLSIHKEEIGTSNSLIRGVIANLKELNYQVGGFKAYMTSDVLEGSGMSSSAAFEVMIGTIISGLYNNMEIHPLTIAQASQYAENNYFKKPCGLMDQAACSIGGLIYIDFGKEPLKVDKLNNILDENNYSLCLVNVKSSHADLTDCYAQIPAEMNEIANYFGENNLSEVNQQEFYKELPNLINNFNHRAILRAMHLFDENRNVDNMSKALENNDFQAFLEIIIRSGNSSYKYLQNIYPNNRPDTQNVAIALKLTEDFINQHEGACRVHGGGFAGTIQAFINDNDVDAYKKYIEYFFGPDSCQVLKIRPVGGYELSTEE